jgi:hypothetical protein
LSNETGTIFFFGQFIAVPKFAASNKTNMAALGITVILSIHPSWVLAFDIPQLMDSAYGHFVVHGEIQPRGRCQTCRHHCSQGVME